MLAVISDACPAVIPVLAVFKAIAVAFVPMSVAFVPMSVVCVATRAASLYEIFAVFAVISDACPDVMPVFAVLAAIAEFCET